MTTYTIRVVVESDDDAAVMNIQDDVVMMIRGAVPSVTVVSATFAPADAPIVDLIDEAARVNPAPQARTQEIDPQAQAADQEEQATEALPTGKEF